MWKQSNLKLNPFILAATLVLVASNSGRADEAQVRKALEPLYSRIDKDLLRLDVKAARALETEDFTMRTKDGRVLNREQSGAQLEQAIQEFANLGRIVQCNTTLAEIKAGSSAAEFKVLAVQKITAIIKDRNNKNHELIATGKVLDFWINTNQGWRIRHTIEVQTTVTLDGQPIEQ